ncbi:MAG: hypothetical protein AAF316_16935, partial [Cyanobacteria bacterium P01_A01_bin.80]
SCKVVSAKSLLPSISEYLQFDTTFLIKLKFIRKSKELETVSPCNGRLEIENFSQLKSRA